MAREFARMKLSIWDDDDFRGLPVRSQHLYFVLMMSPSLSYCGVADWRPARLSGFAGDWGRAGVEHAAYRLAERRYVFVDEDKEEVLLRSFIRNDGLMEKPRMAVSMVNAYRDVASANLRGVIVHELNRLHDEQPNLKGWQDVHGKPGAALGILDKRAVDPGELATDLQSICPSVCNAFATNTKTEEVGICTPLTPSPTPATAEKAPTTSQIAIAIPDEQSRPDVTALCNRLADRIESNGAKRPTIGKTWRDAARLMLDNDKRTYDQVAWLIDWCQADEFWHANILSMPKLREKFDQMKLKATSQNQARNGSNIDYQAAAERLANRDRSAS